TPGLMVALGRLRQLAIGRRLDLEAPVGRLQAEARIIVADLGFRRDRAAAIDGRLVVDTLAEAEAAFDHGVGSIDAVNDNRHTGTPGNNDLKSLGQSRRAQGGRTHGEQDHECQFQSHASNSNLRFGNLTERRIPRVKNDTIVPVSLMAKAPSAVNARGRDSEALTSVNAGPSRLVSTIDSERIEMVMR